MSPAVFVALAEEMGIIDRLGEWVLRAACRQFARWQSRSRRPRPDLPQRQPVGPPAGRLGHGRDGDAARWRRPALAPRRLCLELTESVFMDEIEGAVGQLRDLCSLGVRLAMDDFGTGYSSLSSLRRFPGEFLKIDRSFVAGLRTDPPPRPSWPPSSRCRRPSGSSPVAEGVEADGRGRPAAVARLPLRPGLPLRPPDARATRPTAWLRGTDIGSDLGGAPVTRSPGRRSEEEEEEEAERGALVDVLIEELERLPAQPSVAVRTVWVADQPTLLGQGPGRGPDRRPVAHRPGAAAGQLRLLRPLPPGGRCHLRRDRRRLSDRAGHGRGARQRPVRTGRAHGARRLLGALGGHGHPLFGAGPPGRGAAQPGVPPRACSTTSGVPCCSGPIPSGSRRSRPRPATGGRCERPRRPPTAWPTTRPPPGCSPPGGSPRRSSRPWPTTTPIRPR